MSKSITKKAGIKEAIDSFLLSSKIEGKSPDTIGTVPLDNTIVYDYIRH
jgi:hypothetical protein